VGLPSFKKSHDLPQCLGADGIALHEDFMFCGREGAELALGDDLACSRLRLVDHKLILSRFKNECRHGDGGFSRADHACGA